MVFSSIEFLYMHLPLCMLIYFVIPARLLGVRNFALLVLSLLFYGWGEPIYVFIMLFSIAVDYICGYIVATNRVANPKKAKTAMITSVVLNLSVLGFFKYLDFIIENLALIPMFSSLKPLGITLQFAGQRKWVMLQVYPKQSLLPTTCLPVKKRQLFLTEW